MNSPFHKYNQKAQRLGKRTRGGGGEEKEKSVKRRQVISPFLTPLGTQFLLSPFSHPSLAEQVKNVLLVVPTDTTHPLVRRPLHANPTKDEFEGLVGKRLGRVKSMKKWA